MVNQNLGKDQVFLEEAHRHTYTYDAALWEPVWPAVVLRPESTGELNRVKAALDFHKLLNPGKIIGD